MFTTELQNGTCSDWSVISTSDEGLFRGADIYVYIVTPQDNVDSHLCFET